jgi:hypothetical protein
MRVAVLTLFAFAGLAPAADPPPELALKVRVALALNQCQCETPGAKCADPAADLKAKVAAALATAVQPSKPTPLPTVKPAVEPTHPQARYERLKAAVARTKAPAVFAVGVPLPPGVEGEAFPARFMGYELGVWKLVWEPAGPYVGVTSYAPDWRLAILPGFGLYAQPEQCFGGS